MKVGDKVIVKKYGNIAATCAGQTGTIIGRAKVYDFMVAFDKPVQGIQPPVLLDELPFDEIELDLA
jgi:hypothetical protein